MESHVICALIGLFVDQAEMRLLSVNFSLGNRSYLLTNFRIINVYTQVAKVLKC